MRSAARASPSALCCPLSRSSARSFCSIPRWVPCPLRVPGRSAAGVPARLASSHIRSRRERCHAAAPVRRGICLEMHTVVSCVSVRGLLLRGERDSRLLLRRGPQNVCGVTVSTGHPSTRQTRNQSLCWLRGCRGALVPVAWVCRALFMCRREFVQMLAHRDLRAARRAVACLWASSLHKSLSTCWADSGCAVLQGASLVRLACATSQPCGS